MRAWMSAVVLVAAVFLVAAPKLWSQETRTSSQRTAAPTPTAIAAQPPEQGPEEPAPLSHRLTVLRRFACGDCHGVASGFVMPVDHAVMSEGECQDCHRPASGPPPIALHDGMGHESALKDCGLCHNRFAEPLRLAPAAETLCYRCHNADKGNVLPASHAGRSDAPSTCIVCHETRRLDKPAVPHEVDNWQRCSFCHGQQRLTPLGGAHDALASSQCLSCHGVIQPPGTYSRMHTLATENEGCGSCHAAGKLAPLPASHDGRTEVLCGLCHQPSDEEPPLVPHSLSKDGLCTTCHAEGDLGSLSYDHATRTEQMCVTCHAEQPGGVPAIPHDVAKRTICTSCHTPSSSSSDTLFSGSPSVLR